MQQGTGLIPSWGAKISHALWSKNQNIKKKQNKTRSSTVTNSIKTLKMVHIKTELNKRTEICFLTLLEARSQDQGICRVWFLLRPLSLAYKWPPSHCILTRSFLCPICPRWPCVQISFSQKDTAAAAAKSLQSCPTLCNPIDSSPPGSPVPGILQARTLEWVAISFSNAWKWKVKVKSLSRVRLFTTPWTAAY